MTENSNSDTTENRHHVDYKNYGERGIRFLFSSYQEFLQAVGPRPSRKHTLDRYPNNDGNYEPGNVRWATMKEQCRNRRQNHFLTFQGQKWIVTDWANVVQIKAVILFKRLGRGWCTPCTLTVGYRGKCPHRA